jgi:hypothetical protein
MKSINQLLRDFNSEITEIDDLKVYHYEAEDMDLAPYVVWTEQSEDDAFHSDNKKDEQVIPVIIDFYTQEEFDPFIDEIQECINGIENASWRLSAVDYEDTTKLIHYQWEVMLV